MIHSPTAPAEVRVIVSAAALLMIVLFLIFGTQLEVWTQRFERSAQPPIGRVLRARGDVRRRVARDVSWLPFAGGSALYNLDSIFTGVDSETEIDLGVGATIRVAPLSLVTLRKSGEDEVLDITEGKFDGVLGARRQLLVSRYGKLSVITSGSAGGQISVDARDGAPAQILPTLGTVSILQPEPEAQPKSQPTFRAPPRLLAPATGTVFTLAALDEPTARASFMPGLRINLKWEEQEGASDFCDLELSHTKDFASTVLATRVKEVLKFETPRLREGVYFWRVRCSTGAGTTSPWESSSSFEVRQADEPLAQGPQIEFPANGQAIPPGTLASGLSFTWKDSQPAMDYLIEVARNLSFQDAAILLRERRPAPPFRTNIARAGTYYWRLRAVRTTGELTVFSAPARFRIVISRPEPRQQETQFEAAPSD